MRWTPKNLLHPLRVPPRDVLLITPPALLPRAPQLGVAVLRGFLERRGRDASIADLNLATCLRFLRPESVALAIDQLGGRLTSAGRGRAEVVAATVPAALKQLRHPEGAIDVAAEPELKVHDVAAWCAPAHCGGGRRLAGACPCWVVGSPTPPTASPT